MRLPFADIVLNIFEHIRVCYTLNVTHHSPSLPALCWLSPTGLPQPVGSRLPSQLAVSVWRLALLVFAIDQTAAGRRVFVAAESQSDRMSVRVSETTELSMLQIHVCDSTVES
jgi:hypothetical protein